MPKQILLVHGRGFKPPKPDYERLWRDAVEAGFERDRPELLPALEDARVELVYYADLSAEWLTKVGKTPRPNDLERRRATRRASPSSRRPTCPTSTSSTRFCTRKAFKRVS